MPLMNWDSSLDVGVEAMNCDHRDILDAMNAVYDGSQAGEAGAAMMAKIARLGQITTRHFAAEEAFMVKCNYPDFSTHKMIHTKLLADFEEHARTIGADGGRVTSAFFTFLRLWLSAHIKNIDVKYARHSKLAA